jgi:hypothetical protein
VTGVGAAARLVLADALGSAPPGSPAAALLTTAGAHLDGPLRVALAGRVSAGKSTLLNALLGAPLAATDAGECTRLVTAYRYGTAPAVEAVGPDGSRRPVPFRLEGGGLVIHPEPGDDIAALDVAWPAAGLRGVSYIDTPGLGSPSRQPAAPRDPMADAGGPDAVVYLLRHLHGADVAFLEALRCCRGASAGPVNAIGVLARADEIGGGRRDAMAAAARVAARYRGDQRVRRLLGTVVPVNGLLAGAAAQLRLEDHEALAALAAAAPAALARALLAPELFVRAPDLGAVPPGERAGLLRRLGPFGLRAAVDLLRAGDAPDAAALAARLAALSGIDDLRALIANRFAARAEALQARAALAAAAHAVTLLPDPAAGILEGRIEAALASAHALTEVAELDRMHRRQPDLAQALVAEAARLLGAAGTSAPARLDVPVDAAPSVVRDAALAAVARWRAIAEGVCFDPASARLAAAVVRSAEGILASPRPAPGP